MQGRAEGSDHFRFAEVLSISGSTGLVDVSIQGSARSAQFTVDTVHSG
jgi:hypothetical protein